MNILLVFIPFLIQSYSSTCDCDTYASLLDHAKNAQLVLVGEVISFEDPYYLEGDEPTNTSSPNRNSAVKIKIVNLVKGKLDKKEIKVLGYPSYSNNITEEQPFRMGFEFAQKGAKYIFCINEKYTEKNVSYDLKCCGPSFVTIDGKGYVVGKIENPESIISKPLNWILSQIKS